jgi:hypothetical protein
VNEQHQLYFATRHDIMVNNNGGYYQRGKSYGLEVKLFVAAKYLDHKERLGGLWPVVTKVAAECHVGWDFVVEIERELMENERVLTPEEIYLACNNPIGLGSRIMSEEDFFLLYILYQQQPTRSLKSYVYWLFCCTGRSCRRVPCRSGLTMPFQFEVGFVCLILSRTTSSGLVTLRRRGSILSTLAR